MLRAFVSPALVILAACGDAKEHFDRERTGVMEVTLTFRQGQGQGQGQEPPTFTMPDLALVRGSLVALDLRDIELEPMQLRVADAMRPALLVRLAPTDWPPPAVREEAVAAIRREWDDLVIKVAWSGNRIFLRARAPLDESRMRVLLTGLGLIVVEIPPMNVDEVIQEYTTTVKVGGTDTLLERALEQRLAGTDVVIESSLMVGPRRR